MKRTPRSTSRRATRHCAAEDACVGVGLRRDRRAAASPRFRRSTSINSGTADLHAVGEFRSWRWRIRSHRRWPMRAAHAVRRAAQAGRACRAAELRSRSSGRMLATAGIAGPEDRALEGRGQEAAVEVVQPAGRDQAAVEDDEAGQIVVLAPQAIVDPRPHAGPALNAGSGMEEIVGAGVLGKFRHHRADERPDRRRTRATCGNRSLTQRAALAILAELPRRLHDLADVVELRRLDLEDAVRILAVVAFEHRLVVERIDLATARRPCRGR